MGPKQYAVVFYFKRVIFGLIGIQLTPAVSNFIFEACECSQSNLFLLDTAEDFVPYSGYQIIANPNNCYFP